VKETPRFVRVRCEQPVEPGMQLSIEADERFLIDRASCEGFAEETEAELQVRNGHGQTALKLDEGSRSSGQLLQSRKDSASAAARIPGPNVPTDAGPFQTHASSWASCDAGGSGAWVRNSSGPLVLPSSRIRLHDECVRQSWPAGVAMSGDRAMTARVVDARAGPPVVPPIAPECRPRPRLSAGRRWRGTRTGRPALLPPAPAGGRGHRLVRRPLGYPHRHQVPRAGLSVVCRNAGALRRLRPQVPVHAGPLRNEAGPGGSRSRFSAIVTPMACDDDVDAAPRREAFEDQEQQDLKGRQRLFAFVDV
jgi:hypothetical protein